ncbi:hypothetical protein KVR01_007906 [Diaporthe batatas]|uniref:uncharacterized protein n=1 Tax=Diaporthe batatas TaxID=748121 RepID=UPI001D04D89A|nr:uncharacterized protein KVR01_007906 [Diaporthe batatas]KAG8162141.1 hypothetical protein KVR01_007906 [Diaporthe batatas]
MQITAVRCPRCLLTVYTTISNPNQPVTRPPAPRVFTVAPLADDDLRFYNCPMDVCEYHVRDTTTRPAPVVNLYRNSWAPGGGGGPMCITPGLTVAPRTADTRPLRGADEVAALAIGVGDGDAATATTTTTPPPVSTILCKLPTTPTPAAATTKTAGDGDKARPVSGVIPWRAGPVPQPTAPTTTTTPTTPTTTGIVERPAAVATTTTKRPRSEERPPTTPVASTCVKRPAPPPLDPKPKPFTTARLVAPAQTPQAQTQGTAATPQQGNHGQVSLQFGRDEAGGVVVVVPPVADIPRPTLAPQPFKDEEPTKPEMPTTPSPIRQLRPKPAAETETPAPAPAPVTKERVAHKADGKNEAKKKGAASSSPAAAADSTPTGLVASGTKWSDAEVDKLRGLTGRGLRQADIATEMNRSLLSVKYKIAEVRKTDRMARGQTDPN